MKDNAIRAFGIFLNDVPYFVLAVAAAGDHLKVSKARAYGRMVYTTLAHAVSILSLLSFYPGYRAIQIPHEMFFLVLYIAMFLGPSVFRFQSCCSFRCSSNFSPMLRPRWPR